MEKKIKEKKEHKTFAADEEQNMIFLLESKEENNGRVGVDIKKGERLIKEHNIKEFLVSDGEKNEKERDTEMKPGIEEKEANDESLSFDDVERGHSSKFIATVILSEQGKISEKVNLECLSQDNKDSRMKENCNKTKLEMRLQQNLADHPVSKAFICDLCKKKFTCKSHLDRHIVYHSDEKPFTCEMCDKKFKCKKGLNSHMTTHYYAKPFTCDICDCTFKRNNNLKTHMLNHSGKRPFVCTICEKGFTIQYAFKMHMKTHSDEKPFICEVCGKTFKQKSSLKSHMQTHESF